MGVAAFSDSPPIAATWGFKGHACPMHRNRLTMDLNRASGTICRADSPWPGATSRRPQEWDRTARSARSVVERNGCCCEPALTPLGIRFPELGQFFGINLGRRFAFFLCRAFRFPDRHQEFGLLSRQLTAAGLPAAFSDLGEIFTNLARQRDSFGRHWVIVASFAEATAGQDRLMIITSRVLRQQPTRIRSSTSDSGCSLDRSRAAAISNGRPFMACRR